MSFIAVMPGQGSQNLGMLAEYADEQVVQESFALANKALGLDLWQLTQDDEDRLNQTAFTQPALLTASVALYRLWQQKGGAKPAFMAGHSLGEYSALVCAGALSLDEAVLLVHQRGLVMQEAVPAGVGGMAAVIGMDDNAVVAMCAKLAGDEVLSAVNFNAPGQVVVAGHKTAVERVVAEGRNHGARMVKALPVSVPSHCSLMREAAEAFAEHLKQVEISKPAVPVIQNVTAAIADSAEAIQANLLAQLYSPVRWVESMQFAVANGVTTAVEFGPGAVLQGLNKRIDKNLVQAGTAKPESLAAALAL